MVPDNRGLAGLILIGVAGVAVVACRSTRGAAFDVVKAAAKLVILLPFLLMVLYACGLVALAARIGWWDTRLLVETLLWVLGPGVSLLFGAATHRGDEHFFRGTVARAWRLTGFVEVFVGLYVLSLPAELILIPVVTLLGLLSAVSGTRPELATAKRAVDFLLGVVGVGLIAYVVGHLVADWNSLDLGHILGALAVPPYLTLGFIPYLYGITLWAAYSQVFVGVNFHVEDRVARWRVKLGLVLAFGFRAARAKAFTIPRAQRITEAGTVREARAIGRAFLESERQRDQPEQEAAERLARNAGVDRADAEGRPLNEREFAETRTALQWLATAQMAWYNNQGGRYRADLLEMLAPFDGLPANHGIHLFVGGDGQSWWAWRRTTTGWCFAIGAAGPPPDQWLCDGPEPPAGFPGEDPAWGERWGVTAENW